MENVQTEVDYPKGLTFEHVWAALQETDRLLKESIKENDKRFEESRKENDKRFEESIKENDKRFEESVKENDKRFGNINNRFGELVECIISPNLLDKFSNLGIDFQTASSNYKVRDHKNKIYFEIDVLLQNGDTAMLVEIKTNLTISYINEHINRLEKMRLFANLHCDKRTFLGAVAGVIIPKDVKEYALNNGFYLVEPSGEDLNITTPYKKAKEW